MTDIQKLKAELEAKDREITALNFINAEQKEKLDRATRRLASLMAERVSLTASGMPQDDFKAAAPTTPFEQRIAGNANRIRESRLAN